MAIRTTTLVVCLLSFAGPQLTFAAESEDLHPFLHRGFSLDVGVFFPDRHLDLSVNGTVGGINEEIDFDQGFQLGSDLIVELTSWIDYELFINMTFLNESSGKYQHHIVSTLSTDLVGEVDLDVSFIWERTKNPQERIDTTIPEKDYFRLMFSVGYDF